MLHIPRIASDRSHWLRRLLASFLLTVLVVELLTFWRNGESFSGILHWDTAAPASAEHYIVGDFVSHLFRDAQGEPIHIRYSVVRGMSPFVLHIPAFGENHRLSKRSLRHFMELVERKPELNFTHVYVDPQGPRGHHYFLNSPANGPMEDVLVNEFLPYVAQVMSLSGAPVYVTGHSSGGWSCVWLQLRHPEVFRSCLATSPDPLDFHHFYGTNLYDSTNNNFYHAPTGQAHVALRGHALSLEKFVLQEQAEAEEGEVDEWTAIEAAYSPTSAVGIPLQLFDRRTGAIDRQVAAHWQKFDALAYLKRVYENPRAAAQLKGKLHLFCGDKDDFFLDVPFRSFCSWLSHQDSASSCELLEGRTHSSMYLPSQRYPGGLTQEILQLIARDVGVTANYEH